LNIQEYKGVWVLVEQRQGQLQKVSLEILGKGREIADKLGQELTAVLLGKDIRKEAEALIHFGADRVIVSEHDAFEPYTTEPYAKVIATLIREKKPEIVLFGATTTGRDLAPRLSARLATGLTADCTKLEVDEANRLLQTRPAFGGNLMATIVCPNHRPQMATVRPGVMEKQKDPRQGTIERVSVSFQPNDLRVTVEALAKTVKSSVNLAEAEVIVSGGRGVGGPEGFKLLAELADSLGGVVGASRAAVDAGWIGHEHQVGQTGKVVKPRIYFACGISGAIQHAAGIQGAECIVAINQNKDAPIFAIADFGIVGDLHQVLPQLLEALKQPVS
jgi:electron transfer flavoprotein alpha subunit